MIAHLSVDKMAVHAPNDHPLTTVAQKAQGMRKAASRSVDSQQTEYRDSLTLTTNILHCLLHLLGFHATFTQRSNELISKLASEDSCPGCWYELIHRLISAKEEVLVVTQIRACV